MLLIDETFAFVEQFPFPLKSGNSFLVILSKARQLYKSALAHVTPLHKGYSSGGHQKGHPNRQFLGNNRPVERDAGE